jgi:hypothetical protein
MALNRLVVASNTNEPEAVAPLLKKCTPDRVQSIGLAEAHAEKIVIPNRILIDVNLIAAPSFWGLLVPREISGQEHTLRAWSGIVVGAMKGITPQMQRLVIILG